MPSSNPVQIPIIIKIIRDQKPGSVLDIGTGYGKYGFLIREYVDQFDRKVTLEGVEPAPRNLRVLAEVYDKLYMQAFLTDWDRQKVFPSRYELGMMIDVLEHFDKAQGFEALHKALFYCKRVLIATPKNPAEQTGAWEAHRSKWNKDDMHYVGNWQDHSTDHTLIGVLTSK
jgi:SAM-dependent methyltransferase